MQGLVGQKRIQAALETLLSQHAIVLERDSEGEITTFFTLLVYLTKLLTIEEGDGVILNLVKAIASDTSHAKVRLNVLVVAYNALHVESRFRASIFLSIVDYAQRTQLIALVRPHLLKIEALMASWRAVDLAERQAILRAVANCLKEIGEEMAAHSVLVRLLSTYEDAPRDALGATKGDALAAIVEAIAFEKVFRLDHFLSMAAIKQLEGDAKYGKAYSLLRLFVSGRLADYTAFKTANPGYVQSLGLDDDKAVRKMRLLSLASLAAELDEISYDVIAETLSIAKDDVETWVIQMLQTDLAQMAMDQRAEIVYVSRASPREFKNDDWAEIARRLKSWRASVSSMQQTIDAHRTAQS